MKKIIAILLALAVVSMAFAQTVSISNELMTSPEITVDGSGAYWGFANKYFLRDEVNGEAVTADGRAKVKGRIRFDLQTMTPDENTLLNLKPRWSWNSNANAADGNRSSVGAVLKPFDSIEIGIGNLDEVGYGFSCVPQSISWKLYSDDWKYGFNTIIGLAGMWQNVHQLINDGIQVVYTGVPGLKIGAGLSSARPTGGDRNKPGATDMDTMIKKGVFNGLALGANYGTDLFSVGARWAGNFGWEKAGASTGVAAETDKSYQDHTITAGITFNGLNEAKIGTTLHAAVGYYTEKASQLRNEGKTISSWIIGVGADFNFRNGISDSVAFDVGYNKVGGVSTKVLPFCIRNTINYSVSSDAKFSFAMCYSQAGLDEKTSVKGSAATNLGQINGVATPSTDVTGWANGGRTWLIGAKPSFSFSMGAHTFSFAVKTVVLGDIIPHAKTGHEWGWTGLKGYKAIVDIPLSWKYTF